jgi:NADH dehydrogenase (ubiquinone) 1 beta subcomplex subunit 8
MFSRRIVAARPLAHAAAPALARRPQFIQQVRTALTEAEHAELADPNMVLFPPKKEGCLSVNGC